MSEPWEQNACFTIKAANAEEVGRIASRLDRYARRIGAGSLFCDYEGPIEDPEERAKFEGSDDGDR